MLTDTIDPIITTIPAFTLASAWILFGGLLIALIGGALAWRRHKKPQDATTLWIGAVIALIGVFLYLTGRSSVAIGPISLRWYGVVYVLGFIGGYWAFRKLAGLTADEADSLTLWAMIGLLIGARTFFFAFYRPDLFSPAEFFAVWHGGMSFHGALLGITVAGWLWARHYKKRFWRIADVGAVLVSFFLALGRLANFANSEIVGTVTNVPWCVHFPHAAPPGNVGCRHPVQLYAAFKDLLTGSGMLLLYKKGGFADGFLFWLFAAIYGVLRFVINIWRADPVIAFGWLKMGQILSVALLLIAVPVLLKRYRKDLQKIFK